MTQNKALSASKKARLTVFLIRKYGNVCWYDKQPFVEDLHELTRTLDHLNNKDDDNRWENIVLCHWGCQQKKKTDPDMQILAMEQLQINVQDPDFLKIETESGSEREKNTDADTDELTDGQINRIINTVVDKFITERLTKDKPDSRLSFIDTMNSITHLVQKETNGRGSQPAVRRAIEVRCCSISEFEIIRDSGKRYIKRRLGK